VLTLALLVYSIWDNGTILGSVEQGGVGRIIEERCVLGEYTLTDMLLAKDTFFGIPPDLERGTFFSITLVSVYSKEAPTPIYLAAISSLGVILDSCIDWKASWVSLPPCVLVDSPLVLLWGHFKAEIGILLAANRANRDKVLVLLEIGILLGIRGRLIVLLNVLGGLQSGGNWSNFLAWDTVSTMSMRDKSVKSIHGIPFLLRWCISLLCGQSATKLASAMSVCLLHCHCNTRQPILLANISIIVGISCCC